MAQFAASKGGRFPQPQLCEGLHYLVSLGDSQHDTEQQVISSQGDGPALDARTAASSSGATMPGTAGVLLIVSAAQNSLITLTCPLRLPASQIWPVGMVKHMLYCYLIVKEPFCGDARASFPPDLGQGVNSALEDVDELAQDTSKMAPLWGHVLFIRALGKTAAARELVDMPGHALPISPQVGGFAAEQQDISVPLSPQVLEHTGDDLSKALPLYEKRRAPHIAALIQLMTFSYPWQYNQDPVQRFLWTINFAIRAFLSKALPAIFSPHSFMLVQVSNLSYKQVLDMTHATTQRLYALFGGLALGVAIVVGKGLKASAMGA
eukprot:1160118-Pelagomonas_calceolata.AAC.3